MLKRHQSVKEYAVEDSNMREVIFIVRKCSECCLNNNKLWEYCLFVCYKYGVSGLLQF